MSTNTWRLLFGAGLALFCGAAMAEPISATIAAITGLSATASTALTYAGAGFLGGKLAMKATKTPAAPQVKPPAVMPVADDDAAVAARRRQIAMMQARGGRASTILSDPDDKLGG
jgi:hypothetical protein